ncbi:biotin/lipoyl-binding protein [Rubinisphaera italica]|nr:biotin/lipoyl-binding protein [Rubinisphaera italica]
MEAVITTIEHRPLGLRMRPDLRSERQAQQGQVWWVVKDPLSLKYFRLREEQYAALNLLDGETSLEKIREILSLQFPAIAISHHQLQSLCLMFHRSGLVLADGFGQAHPLLKRKRTQQRRILASKFMSLLWIKLPGFDPDHYLSRLAPKLSWLFHPVSVVLSLVWILAALFLVLNHFAVFQAKLPSYEEFFSAGNLLWLMAGLAITKVFHELGHAIACKHFGGECHNIGIMLLVFTPCLYCDTSDSWMLANKWKRAAIGAAGMYVELIIAAGCVFVWWNTQPGLIHYLCLSMVTVSSISTLIFNSNPLLRYDGYYILSDLMEVPNLSSRAQSVLVGVLEHIFLNLPSKLKQVIPRQHRTLFVTYAIAAPIYRWFVVIVILWFLAELFEPWGLKSIGYVLISMSVAGMILTPAWKVFQYFRTPGKFANMRKFRVTIASFSALLVLSLIALIPVPQRIFTSVVLQPRDAERVYVSVPGSIFELAVEPGDRVARGTVLAELKNPEIENELVRLRGQLERVRQQLKNLQRQQSDDASAVQSLPQVQETLTSLTDRVAQLESEQSRLKLTASRSGIIIAGPAIPSMEYRSNDLPVFSGTPFQPKNKGAWLETGTLFCLIGEASQYSAILLIDQTEIDRVRRDQRVDIRVAEYPARSWRGRIRDLSTNRIEFAPRETSIKTGGTLQTETNADGLERPLNSTYEARVPLEISDESILPGFRGTAKIHIGSQPLGKAWWRTLVTLFRFG